MSKETVVLNGGYLLNIEGEIYDLVEQKRVVPKLEALTGELFVNLRTRKNSKHYNRKYIHTLVAKNFHPDRDKFPKTAKVGCRDLDPTNVSLDNLYFEKRGGNKKKHITQAKHDIWNINSDAIYC